MGIQEFNSLVGKFKKGQCSLDELKCLEDYLQNEKKVKDQMMDEISQMKDNDSIQVDYSDLFQRIQKQISARTSSQISRILNLNTMVRWAAAVVFAFVFGGLASYFIFNNSSNSCPSTYSEIVAPYGSKTEMILPDGSKVWLNAGSKLKYPNDFNSDNRDIILEGEAFFQVEKNKTLPFVVNALGLEVNVVGTTFNVKAYESESTITTILVEGKVVLESEKYHFENQVSLCPSQKAVFSKTDREIVVADLDDVYSEISWKDNLLIIKGEELSDLVVKLERKYNVNFEFGSEEVKDFKFSGTLKDETIQQVLDVLKLSAPIKYKINGKNIALNLNDATKDSYTKFLKKTN